MRDHSDEHHQDDRPVRVAQDLAGSRRRRTVVLRTVDPLTYDDGHRLGHRR
ncbi:hypothetical protein AB0L70_34420 [Kribbella sp. NPDC051952]|uniref:hypothetical protein n=1 Tax=Kribbella sp. NPDC051952 TaxID=3154851 RepID=UPI003418586E